MLAHDLRTPMCCAAGAAQIALLALEQGERVDEQLKQILVSIRAMDQVIGQVCDAQAGEFMRFTAQALQGELTAIAATNAKEKEIDLSIDLSGLGTQTLIGDYPALLRVLMNLTSNAVKYTPCGGRVSLRACMETSNGGYTGVFCVEDNGMGMSPEFLDRMYRPLARAQETMHLPGKGLGLAIVDRLVRKILLSLEKIQTPAARPN